MTTQDNTSSVFSRPSSSISDSSEPIDWLKCIICQVHKPDESLQSPSRLTRQVDAGAGYKSLADNLTGFAAIGELKLPYDLDVLSK